MPRHPGITFETVTPSPPETLPRMDVAAFVGFATRGPIDVPVPVEDLARFRDVFGPPLRLVHDAEDGRTQTANLKRAVKSFFRNGGRRCWVVRVANSPSASGSVPVTRTSFPLPGLVAGRDGRPASVRARCYGASFDDRRVGTLLHAHLLPDPSSIEDGDDGVQLAWSTARQRLLEDGELTNGDLLRLSMEGGPVAYATVVSRGRGEGNRARTVETGPVSLFWRDPPLFDASASFTAELKPIPDASGQGTSSAAGAKAVFPARVVRKGGGNGAPQFRLVAGGDAVPGGVECLEDRVVHVRQSGSPDLEGWLHLGAPGPSGGDDVAFSVRDALWPASVASVYGSDPLPVDSIERLTFDLLVWRDQELQTRASDLGFTRSHPRTWTNLPVDKEVFGVEDGEAETPPSGTLREDLFDPRFPMAAPDPGALTGQTGRVPDAFIPLGMTDRPDPNAAQGRVASGAERSRLEKERLSTFSVDAFLDGELAGERTDRLEQKADDKVHLRRESASGLHSLWPVREVTLLAVPDAVHRGWSGPLKITPQAASTPVLLRPEVFRDADPPVVRLSWNVSALDDPAVEVEVQEATEPTFDTPVVRYRGSDASVDRFVREDAPVTLYFRLRVVKNEVPGAWSNTRRVAVPEPDFAACKGRPGVPQLSHDDNGCLRWTPQGEDARQAESTEDESGDGESGDPGDGDGGLDCKDIGVYYEVQVDTTPTFETPVTKKGVAASEGETEGDNWKEKRFHLGTDPPVSCSSDAASRSKCHVWTELDTEVGTPPVRYVRVRAVREGEGQQLYGGWSRTVAVIRQIRAETELVSEEKYDDPDGDSPGGGREGLYAVHRAMLRFGAARGDVVSVLSLPRDDQENDARRHAARLRTPGAVLETEEEKTLSYGALYHPWLLGPEAGGRGLRPTPPDGAACGTIARRTLRDGAWAAPANEPVAGVQTVVPPLSPGSASRLADHNMNVFGEEPQGVLTLGSASLSRDPDFTPLGTRRLLILIRRLTLREGPELVFDNNTPLLRRRVAEQFDALLRRLFKRGAFAGQTPEEAYRVVTGPGINPPEQVERGRLVVELRVAPARPLEFLTVRLVHRRNQSPSVVEGGAV